MNNQRVVIPGFPEGRRPLTDTELRGMEEKARTIALINLSNNGLNALMRHDNEVDISTVISQIGSLSQKILEVAQNRTDTYELEDKCKLRNQLAIEILFADLGRKGLCISDGIEDYFDIAESLMEDCETRAKATTSPSST